MRDWQQAGVWDQLRRVLLDWLGTRTAIDLEGAALDNASVAAKGGEATGPNPTDRGQPGTKCHVLMDANSIPLTGALSPANLHDSRMLEAVVHAVPPIRQSVVRPCKRPAKLHADKAYDHRRCRAALVRRHIHPRIARSAIESNARLGRHRWVVERTLAWRAQFRRIAIRYERRADIHQAFHNLAAAIIIWRFVQRWHC